MSFISCNNCGWSQDDFWSVDGYNPFRKDIIDWWREIFAKGMLGEKIEMDMHWAEEAKIPFDVGTRIINKDNAIHLNQNGDTDAESPGEYKFALIDFRDMLAFELDHVAKVFHNMEWPTYAEFKEEDVRECPQCGSTQDWDID